MRDRGQPHRHADGMGGHWQRPAVEENLLRCEHGAVQIDARERPAVHAHVDLAAIGAASANELQASGAVRGQRRHGSGRGRGGLVVADEGPVRVPVGAQGVLAHPTRGVGRAVVRPRSSVGDRQVRVVDGVLVRRRVRSAGDGLDGGEVGVAQLAGRHDARPALVELVPGVDDRPARGAGRLLGQGVVGSAHSVLPLAVRREVVPRVVVARHAAPRTPVLRGRQHQHVLQAAG